MDSLKRLPSRLWQKFVGDPAGLGRPAPAEVFDREYRSGSWDHFSDSTELPRYLALAGAIHHHYPEKPAVLDLGCGNGRLAEVFQPHPFSRYVGVDLSTAGLERARTLALPRVEFLLGDYETWRPAGRFDAIVFNESIGYARDPAATLAAFRAVLTPGGLFFISLFRFGHAAAQWRRLAGICATVAAAAVTDASGEKTWDIKVLRPRP
ncbi:class I SAM-dependent methyltransferase [Opitutus sp. GAS368]|jgi:SAM-dependent methyltransferase|uniref:class I SAM-dependent methyltransferase n=1 Tax=Opitutus sp. GAS368 TaxID=1882749 RepID=UPI0008793552|nr:class I SAM-dependent methyltransferase [Opitutus sp. GAS368]SDS64124.1 Methyltransferase domain-containing protein [Opitutus sp. GAS368]